MKNYKGYYVDDFVFHSESEIDAFLKKQAVDYFIWLNKYFSEHMTVEASVACSEQADRLHNEFGLSWEEIEEMEINDIA